MRLALALCAGMLPAAFASQACCQAPAAAATVTTEKVRRQVEFALETERLYRLTCELKVELQKNGSDTLSVEAVKKLVEIERLVQRLNEEMRRK